ncbi:ATP-grasp domain-containing protein [Granulicella arctica]|uniref:ATP-grasp domain-containing protein n=1 Tax=Granulicella arctica TaxID=940613 RepID=UPI0021E09ED8|nr:ATPase [Granulicella arctica]
MSKPTIFCISTYEKGQAFLREVHRQGADVILLTVESLRDADWPREELTELITMPDKLTPEQLLNTVMYLTRSRRIDRIVALDEFDLESAAMLREHLRLSGMGLSATAFFRDKLAMRTQAKAAGVPVPEFTGVFNYDDLRSYMAAVPGPWLLKPRTNASAIGIKNIVTPEDLWRGLDTLGDLQSHYVMERFVKGEVFHVEGVTWEGKVLFAAPHQYGHPPMQTMHQGGVFTTRALSPKSADAKGLVAAHREVIKALGMVSGVTHTEFIKSAADGKFYFLESAARVGGAYIAEVVEAATGLNPWVEWARIEVAVARGEQYSLPKLKGGFAGSVICLARQEHPDTGAYQDAEIVHRLQKHHHAGLIVRSDSAERVEELVGSYGVRFLDQFCAVEPVPDKPTA